VTGIQKQYVPKRACPRPSHSSNTHRICNLWMPGKNRKTVDKEKRWIGDHRHPRCQSSHSNISNRRQPRRWPWGRQRSWNGTKKDNPPMQMKVLPIAAIPHKLKAFRSILDLSFMLRLRNGTTLPSVNSSTTKTAPSGAINKLGHSLQQSYTHSQRPTKMTKSSWQNGILKKVPGDSMPKLETNGILHMCCHMHQENL
jgi:hypothetical protein